MDIKEVLRILPWTYEERRDILSSYFKLKGEQKILELAIARKITEMKLKSPVRDAKYFEISYDPSFYDIQSPIIEINDDDAIPRTQIVYKTFTLDMSALRAMVIPVIHEHIKQGAYPERVYRLVIGIELKNAVTHGELPEHQFEFGVEPYFKIVYCPTIIGIIVIP